MDRPLVVPKPTKLPTNAWTSERPTELAGAYRFACTVNANIGALQVAYREKITVPPPWTISTRSRPAARASFARVKIFAEPASGGKDVVSENTALGSSVPKEFIPGVEKGLESVLGSGALAGFAVVDLKMLLIDVAYHEVDSSALAFEIAACVTLRQALQKAGPSAARADHQGRSGDAGRLHRLCHRRPQLAARSDPGPGVARRCQRHQHHGAARQHVRLPQRARISLSRSRDTQSAIQSRRSCAFPPDDDRFPPAMAMRE
jgi:hypothetical protein